MNKKKIMTLDELLDAVVLEESEPTHERLMKWCARYPAYRGELVEFFATWAVQRESKEEVVIDADRVASRMVSHALDMLYREDAALNANTPAASEGRLRNAIVSKGLSETEFANQCELDRLMVAKLDRRLIRLDTIPRLCLEWMAAALSRTVAEIKNALTGPPVPSTSHKARVRPACKLENFIDAVGTSELSAAQKQEWARIVDAEQKLGGRE